jgi:hypothetical protein
MAITGLVALIWGYFGRLYLIRDPDEWRIANQQLGYPLYIIPLIGVTHILGGVGLLIPNVRRLTEWAYAGLTINLLLAFYSQLNGRGSTWDKCDPILVMAFVFASYVLRRCMPANRWSIWRTSSGGGPPQLFLSQHHRNCGCPIHDAASSRHGWHCTTAHTTSAAAILTSQGHENKVYELAGDESFTLSELAVEVSEVAKTTVAYQDLLQEEYEKALLRFGLPMLIAAMRADSDVGAAKVDLGSQR